MNKKTLLVDTNFSSAPIYDFLSKSGHDVYLVGGNDRDYLAKSLPNYINLDYRNIDLLRKKIEHLSIDYIVPGCNDISYEVCSILNESEQYPGIDKFDTLMTLHNKKKFREFAKKNMIPTPKIIENINDADFYNKPMIVKPVDSFSGKGISVLRTPEPEDLKKAAYLAIEASRSKTYLTEEYIDGQLYSHSAFIVNKKIVADFIVKEYCTVNRFVVNTSHVDNKFPENIKAIIVSNIEKISELLNLKDGLIHTQFIYNGKNYFLIEITRRCPGDLYGKLIEFSTGYPYVENYAKNFIGGKICSKKQKISHKYIIRHTISQGKSLIFNSISFNKKIKIKSYVPLAVTGDTLQPSPNGRVGILFLKARSKKNMRKILKCHLNEKIYQIAGK